jgi:hypothetical protein
MEFLLVLVFRPCDLAFVSFADEDDYEMLIYLVTLTP